MRPLLFALVGLLAVACGGKSDPVDSSVGGGTDDNAAVDDTSSTDGVVCELGTIYPTAGVIDPDNPVYSGSDYSQAEVTAAFDEARADDSMAYRAYKAAYTWPDVMECAFCSCGCADMSIDHQSAVDCFKDMHGFT